VFLAWFLEIDVLACYRSPIFSQKEYNLNRPNLLINEKKQMDCMAVFVIPFFGNFMYGYF
jgi:hypothetical protein